MRPVEGLSLEFQVFGTITSVSVRTHDALSTVSLCVCCSEHQMMTRPLSAVGYRRPLSQHARRAMILKPDLRYKVSCTVSSPFRVEDLSICDT